jgi:hypothetical protein
MTMQSRGVARRLVIVVALSAAACSGDDAATPEDPSGTVSSTTNAATSSAGEADASVTETPETDDESDDAMTVDAGLAMSGPISAGSGIPQTSTPIDLAARGYVEEEYFVSGDAVSYEQAGVWGSDGAWDVDVATTESFTTRILVRRPADASAYNGTTVVEWFNVSSDVDIDIDFVFASEEILRGGYAWVGVSAQAVGITGDGVDSPFGPGALGLKAWDPARYESLAHPGDAFSYDIFSQVGAALREPGSVDPLGGLGVERLLATGESQSAFRLLTYANAVQPVAEVYDAILIHSRNGSGAPLTGETMAGGEVPEAASIRTDLEIPVFQIQTETDLFSLGSPFPPARQPDTDRIRTWEVAGLAHSDSYYLARLSEQGTRQFEGFLDLSGILAQMNSGPQNHVMNAALRLLDRWVADGTPPPTAAPIEALDGAIVRDVDGIALGGLRTPHVDIPIATLTGEGLSVVGLTLPFDEAALAARYGDEATYIAAFSEALDGAIDAGFLAADDREQILTEAAARYPGP